MNKFERRFVIVDLMTITGSLSMFIWGIRGLDYIKIVVSSLIGVYYYFVLRKALWRDLETKEQAELLSNPNENG